MAFKNNASSDDDDYTEISEINIIPLVDVMLVLLIIFMVAAPLSITGINVTLPTSQARSKPIETVQTVLTIDQAGNYYIDKLRVEKPQLLTRLKAIYQDRDQKDLYIRADKAVPYGFVVDAMGIAKSAGISKLSMLTKPLEQPAPKG